ncbi:hypothetical protein [Streptomyces sp. NPDC088727]|uniref:hypothetical protein n=1 Tax=Streptomyces sp. NPDC088727 TaxID=3365875 RepID=UPI0037FCFF39
MLGGRRTPTQSMPERLPDGTTQAPQQFVNQSPRDPLPVRRRAARSLSEAITSQAWVADGDRVGCRDRGEPVWRTPV